MSSTEQSVRAANARFYEAFREQDVTKMAHLWARSHVVVCIHPGWRALHGRDAVMRSWRSILGSADSPPVEHDEEAVVVLGSSAFVTCLERIEDTELIATNVFALEDDEWRLVHHHAGPIAQERDEVSGPDAALN